MMGAGAKASFLHQIESHKKRCFPISGGPLWQRKRCSVLFPSNSVENAPSIGGGIIISVFAEIIEDI